jgi:DNA-binding cell septation regulator SpoVG
MNKIKTKKFKQTCIEKYGVDNPNKSKEIREKINKTILKKYGVSNISQNEEIKKKIIETCLKKFKVKYFLQSKEIRNKINDTVIKKYGVKYLFNSEIVKDNIRLSNIKKYGFPNVSQNAKIFEKQLLNSFKLKEFKFPCGNIIKVQGYEPFLLKILVNDFNYTYNDIIVKRTEVPEIWYEENNKKHRYYCDIYVPKTNTIYEVKSTWTYNNNLENTKLKKEACLKAGYLYELFIFDSTGKIILC